MLPCSRIRYDGCSWVPAAFTETKAFPAKLNGTTVDFVNGRGYRLVSGFVPAMFLSDRAMIAVADFPRSMTLSPANFAWGIVVRGEEIWVRVPWQADFYLVQAADVHKWYQKYPHLEVGARSALAAVSRELPVPNYPYDFECHYGIPYYPRELCRVLGHLLQQPVEAVSGSPETPIFQIWCPSIEGNSVERERRRWLHTNCFHSDPF